MRITRHFQSEILRRSALQNPAEMRRYVLKIANLDSS